MTFTNGVTQGLAPEGELILATSSVADEGERAERIREALARDLDWDFVVECGLKNRVQPLIYEGLSAVADERVPVASLEALKSCYQRNQFRNLHLLRELLELFDRFEEQGIRLSPYKGLVSAVTLYEDLGLRQFYDLDLLVRKEDLPRVRALMLASGFEALEDPRFDGSDTYLEQDCELHFEKKEENVFVEVHWDILPTRHRMGLEVEDFWDRLVPQTLSNTEFEVLDLEDLFLVLCIHGGEKHRWFRLHWLEDIARILRAHPELDWALLMERAAETGGRERTVLLGAFLAWVLLDAPLPEEISRRAAQLPGMLTQAALRYGHIFRLDSAFPGYSRWRDLVADVAAKSARRGIEFEERPGLFSYLGAVLKPEWSDRQALNLPPQLSFLYVVYRPLRLLGRQVKRLFGRR